MCMHINRFAVHLKTTRHCKPTTTEKKKNHSKPGMVKRRAFSIQHCKGKRKCIITRNQALISLLNEVLSILEGTQTAGALQVGDLQYTLRSSFKTQTVSSPGTESNQQSKSVIETLTPSSNPHPTDETQIQARQGVAICPPNPSAPSPGT